MLAHSGSPRVLAAAYVQRRLPSAGKGQRKDAELFGFGADENSRFLQSTTWSHWLSAPFEISGESNILRSLLSTTSLVRCKFIILYNQSMTQDRKFPKSHVSRFHLKFGFAVQIVRSPAPSQELRHASDGPRVPTVARGRRPGPAVDPGRLPRCSVANSAVSAARTVGEKRGVALCSQGVPNPSCWTAALPRDLQAGPADPRHGPRVAAGVEQKPAAAASAALFAAEAPGGGGRSSGDLAGASGDPPCGGR
eukprot:scaffold7326_cov249-Pinguiococcus_pyrenoidosus.AAC.11